MMKWTLAALSLALIACGTTQPFGIGVKTQAEDPTVWCEAQRQLGPGYHDLDPLNMDQDPRNDLAVYRPASGENGYWYWQNHATQLTGLVWGRSGDFMMPQDYNGDGLSDLAVFRPSDGGWYLLESDERGWTRASWNDLGEADDQPVAADYDADCKADIATWTPATGQWLIQPSRAAHKRLRYQLGTLGDTPVADDYDGDGRADPAVYRDNTWSILFSATGQQGERSLEPAAQGFPVAMNYDGDRKGVDVATFDLATGVWRIDPTSGSEYSVKFGAAGDIPAPGYYSGRTRRLLDNTIVPMADLAVFRAGMWYIQGHFEMPYCTLGVLGDQPATVCHFGLPGDLPIRRQRMP